MKDRELIDAIKQIYSKYPSGGALHIVLDDGNTEDDNIRFCIDFLPEMEKEKMVDKADEELFIKTAWLLLSVKERKRNAIISKAFEEMKGEV